MKRVLFATLPLLLLVTLLGCAPSRVADKKVVQMSYKLTLTDGTVVQESPEGQPLEFMVGVGKMIPALETEIHGLKTGEKKTFQIKAADAYGEYDQDALQEVPKENFPADASLEVGQTYSVQTPSGTLTVKIAAIKGKTVTVDFNHPLAGKDLTFAVQILKIRDATRDELLALQEQAQATPQ